MSATSFTIFIRLLRICLGKVTRQRIVIVESKSSVAANQLATQQLF